jgi:DNA-binding FrmR family transcriptional regulator
MVLPGGEVYINFKKVNMQEKKKLLVNYRKAQSLLGKIIEMLERDTYCIDIMQQNLAVMGLLKSANGQLLERHLQSCFKNVMESGSEGKKQKMIGEILTVTKLNGR